MNHLTTFYIVLLLILYAIRLYETWPRDDENKSSTLTIKSEPQIYCPKDHLRNLGTIALTLNNIDYYVIKDGEYLGIVNHWELKAIKRGRLPRRNHVKEEYRDLLLAESVERKCFKRQIDKIQRTKIYKLENQENFIQTVDIPVRDEETGNIRMEEFMILGSSSQYYRQV